MDNNALIPQDKRNALQAQLDFYESIKGLKITTDDEYNNASDRVNKLKKAVKELDEHKKSITKEWANNKSYVDGEYKTVMDKLDNAIKFIGQAMGMYHAEKVRKAEEEQRKAEAEAEKKRQEAQAKADAELKKAEEYQKQGRDDMAAKAAARADSAIQKTETIVAPVIEAAKPAGTSYREDWGAAITDKQEAVKACMKSPLLEPLVIIDLKGVERIQKASKGNLVVPGIQFTKKFTPISRG